MTENKPKYLIYLLRNWVVEEGCGSRILPKTVWRASLENINTHTRYGFANLGRAFEFLHQQTISKKEDCDEMD